MPQSPARLRRREQEARLRESRALELYAQGARTDRIAAEVDVTPGYVSRLISRALEHRAQEEGPTVEAAKAGYLMRLEAMVQAYMPLVQGGGTADDGSPVLPDVRAGELVLKILDRMVAVQGKPLAEAVQGANGRIDHYLHVENGQDIRATILEQLAEAAAHMRVVDGELAGAGTALERLQGQPELDSKPAPPADWQPPMEEGEAA